MILRIFLFSVLILSGSFVYADEAKDALVAKVIEAYGGKAIAELSSVQLHDVILTTSLGQEHDPDLDEVNRLSQALVVDYVSNRSVLENWGTGRGGEFQGATFSDGENASNVNFTTSTFGDAQSADVYTFAGGLMRTTDALLVYEMSKAVADVKIDGEVEYMNRSHTRVVMPFPQSPELTLYIDNETYLVSKMTRTTQFGDLDYVFSEPKNHGGVTYAGAFQFFVQGDVNLMSVSRNIWFNEPLDDADFALPAELSRESERIDTSEMMANRISDSVYHIGQGGGWSLFVDAGDHVIAAGGYPGLSDRFERYKEETGIHKALRYQVVTHHHNDHLGGLGEAVELGAELVTVRENIETIQDTLDPSPADWNFLPVGSRTSFGVGEGQVDVYEISTSHAKSYLLLHVPAQQTIFIADHFGSPFRSGTPNANLNTVTMLDALNELDLKIRHITTAHSARVFSFKEMKASVEAYVPIRCEMQRVVCP